MTRDPDAAAREILRQNDRGTYSVPNGKVYPFQWNWDSAFVALGFDTFDRNRAWIELETLFAAQWDDGFVPHIVFWKDDPGYFPGPGVWATNRTPVTSGITQPPVAGSVLRALWDSACAAGEGEQYRARVEKLFDQTLDWHRWFARNRDPEGRGVVVAMHPWETGRDNSPEWDVPGEPIDISNVGEYVRRDTGHLDAKMRPTKLEYDRYLALVQFGRALGWDHAKIAASNPFRVADVGMSMILLRANRDMAELARSLGRSDHAAELDALVAKAERGIGWLCSGGCALGRCLRGIIGRASLVDKGRRHPVEPPGDCGSNHQPQNQSVQNPLERTTPGAGLTLARGMTVRFVISGHNSLVLNSGQLTCFPDRIHPAKPCHCG